MKINDIFTATQEQLFDLMVSYLKEKYSKVDILSSYYIIAYGSLPIGLVAHLDTVYDTPPKYIYYQAENKSYWSPEGLGADDRAGVMGIIELIEKGYRPTVILCCDEEPGCFGALALTGNIEPPKLKFLLELDRQGKDEFVVYDCKNIDFIVMISNYGFALKEGSYSDIKYIAKNWNIAGANLSIGYINQHSYQEELYTDWYKNTIKKVEKIFTEVDKLPFYKFKRKRVKF